MGERQGEDARYEQVGWINAAALQTLRSRSAQAVTVWTEPHNWPDYTGRSKPMAVEIPLYAMVAHSAAPVSGGSDG